MTRGGPGSATTVFSWMGYAYAFQFFKFGEGAAILYVLTVALPSCSRSIYFVVLGPRRSGAADGDGGAGRAAGSRGRVRSMAVLPPFRPRRAPRCRPRPRGRRRASASAAVTALRSHLVGRAVRVARADEPDRPVADLVRTPAAFFPSTLTLHNFIAVLIPDTVAAVNTSVQAQRVPFSLLNSFIVGAVVAVVSVALGSLAGYAFSRNAKARTFQAALWGLMLTRMTPSLALILPYFIVFRDARADRHAAGAGHRLLFLPAAAERLDDERYFEGVPPNLDRAALVDGCTRAKMLWKIVLPVARPGVVATAHLLLPRELERVHVRADPDRDAEGADHPGDHRRLPQPSPVLHYGPMFAATVLAIAPPVAVAFLFQRYLVQGALSGAVKG